MPTIYELFQNKELLFPGGNTAEGAVKAETETLIEQETTGVRIKSAVEINNPLIYGNESIRIVNRSTPILEDMKSGTGGTGGGGGLIGKALSSLTGGKINSIADARDKVNDKLGIPSNQIPTRLVGKIEDLPSSTPITQELVGGNGTELGKFLKQTGGGNFSTIGKNIVGQGISLAKDKLKSALLGDPATVGVNPTANDGFEYSDKSTYSSTIGEVKYESSDTISETTLLPSADSIGKLKSKTTDLLNKNKLKTGDTDSIELSTESPYSSITTKFRVNDSNETNIKSPSDQENTDVNQLTDNKLTEKLPVGETHESTDYSSETPYSNTSDRLTINDSNETNIKSPSDQENTDTKQESDNKLTENKPLGETQESTDYSSDTPYSNTSDRLTINDSDETNIKSPSDQENTDTKQETDNKLTENKPLGETQESTDYSSDTSYSNISDRLTINDSDETNIESPSEQDIIDIKQETDNKLTENNSLGETHKSINYSKEKTYSKTLKDINYTDEGGPVSEFTRIDITKVSPTSGVKRSDHKFGKQGDALSVPTDKLPNHNPTSPYTGNDGDVIKEKIESRYKLTKKDKLNTILPSDTYALDDKKEFIKVGSETYHDFIPLWIKRYGSNEKPIAFRAILSGLSETSSPDWSGNQFVGNPYKFYMYAGVERSVTFSIKLFASSADELKGIWSKLAVLTSYTYPIITGETNRAITTPPIIQFRLGDMYNGKTNGVVTGQEGFIESLTTSIPDESNWETGYNPDGSEITDIGVKYLPKMVDVSIGIKFIETQGSEEKIYGFDTSTVT